MYTHQNVRPAGNLGVPTYTECIYPHQMMSGQLVTLVCPPIQSVHTHQNVRPAGNLGVPTYTECTYSPKCQARLVTLVCPPIQSVYSPKCQARLATLVCPPIQSVYSPNDVRPAGNLGVPTRTDCILGYTTSGLYSRVIQHDVGHP